MNRKIMVATGILLAAAAALSLSEKVFKKEDERLGKPILNLSAVIGLDAIKFGKGDKSLLVITDKDSVWRLGSESGFPADASKISRLVDDLTRTDVQVLASSAKEPAKEFGVQDAVEVSLKKGGADILSIRLAGHRDGGGQFIAFGNDPRVYLISQNLDGAADESAWELKRLLNIAANQVKKVEFKPSRGMGKKPVTLVREKAEDGIKVDKLTGGSKESSSIRSHEGILSGLDFVTRGLADASDAKKALENPATTKVTLFDGRVFEVKSGFVGDQSRKYFISIRAQKGDTTGENDLKEIDWINSVMTRHTFEVSPMVASRFEKGLEDMLEKKGSKS